MATESKQKKKNIPLIPVVGGLVPFTTIDFPKLISCVVFLQGCPWRCTYCSNPHLFQFREPTERDATNWEYVLDLIRKRVKALEAVVFSGGEVTCQAAAVKSAIEQIHEISPHYKIGLHTNGYDFEGLKLLLPVVDWIGLDIKAPKNRYDAITKTENSGDAAWKALDLLIKSGKEFEARTTCDPRSLDKDAILELAAELGRLGVKNYALQRFRPADKTATGLPSQSDIMQFFADAPFEEKLRALIPSVVLRW